MKTWLIAFLLAGFISIRGACAQDVASNEAQAVRKYPQLGIAGSPFNQKFLAAVQKAKDSNDDILNSPDWPLKIAAQVAADLAANPVTPATDRTTADFAGDVGLRKLVSLTVAQVTQSPFSLKGALIELTGIDHIKTQEVSQGVYEATIYAADMTDLKATITQQQAALLDGAAKLYISVDQPDKDESTVIIHGLRTYYEGLSTMPTVTW